VGLRYPEAPILEALSDEASLRFCPDPHGLEGARKAVCGYYAERGLSPAVEDLFLTSSTSEAYGYLFKLLCDPGDEILVPQPGYPLFDFLGAFENVQTQAYSLLFHDGWHIDLHALRGAISDRTRAILLVHPNNPTGSYVSEHERDELLHICLQSELALIVDEVFLDFCLEGAPRTSFASSHDGLVFVLSGLSKLAGLPQMKLAWILLAGSAELRSASRERLEHISDAYLTVGTPVQVAAEGLLRIAPAMRQEILTRTSSNLRVLSGHDVVTLLAPEGGWYAVLRLPPIASSELWALTLLEEASVYVHPGMLFGFGPRAYVVVSLLPEEAEFQEAFGRLLRVVSDRLDSSDA
jgi:alanine-synthesizing transaminase